MATTLTMGRLLSSTKPLSLSSSASTLFPPPPPPPPSPSNSATLSPSDSPPPSLPPSSSVTIPESNFSYFDSAGELQTTTVSDLTKGKKAILFAVPGAFTPTYSQKQLTGFVEKSSELKAKGVETIACISVNDAFVLKADLKIDDGVLLLSDGNGNFTKSIGCELDLSDKPVGLGVRSRRYAMLVDDRRQGLEFGGGRSVYV